jgi:hypothetical protein
MERALDRGVREAPEQLTSLLAELKPFCKSKKRACPVTLFSEASTHNDAHTTPATA